MKFRLKLLPILALVASSAAMSSSNLPHGGVDCNWVGLTESYPIENGVVLDVGNRDSGCDSRGESDTVGISALPQKRRVLQFLNPAIPPEDLFLRIGKSPNATTVLRWQAIEFRPSVDDVPAGHRKFVRERDGFVTLSTQYPFLFLTYISSGSTVNRVVQSVNVADLYQGDFLQLKVSVKSENGKAKISVQGLGGSHRIEVPAPMESVFPEVWQADAPLLAQARTNFRVRLCNAAGLQPSGPCAIPRLEN